MPCTMRRSADARRWSVWQWLCVCGRCSPSAWLWSWVPLWCRGGGCKGGGEQPATQRVLWSWFGVIERRWVEGGSLDVHSMHGLWLLAIGFVVTLNITAAYHWHQLSLSSRDRSHQTHGTDACRYRPPLLSTACVPAIHTVTQGPNPLLWLG